MPYGKNKRSGDPAPTSRINERGEPIIAVIYFINPKAKTNKVSKSSQTPERLKKVIKYVNNPEKTSIQTNSSLKKENLFQETQLIQEDLHHEVPNSIHKEMLLIEKMDQGDTESIERALKYTTNPVKTIELVSGINCTPETAYSEMICVKTMFNKLDGRQFIHFVQSFHPAEPVTPQQVHEIGVRLAKEFERFAGFQIVVATHTDEDHLHSHFVINSVNMETGLKWQQSPHQMEYLKNFSDKLCREYGLSVIEFKETKHEPTGEYRAKGRGASWKHELRLAVDACMKNSISREDFIENMKKLGYKTIWSDTRKDVTFYTPSGHRCRNVTLDKALTKEALLKAFETNKELGDPKAMAEQIKHLETAYLLSKIERLSESAEKGDSKAQFQLGRLYLKGEPIEKDIEKAERFLTLAAKQNNMYAQYTLGKLYLDGKEVPQNIEVGVKHLMASAQQGSKIAQYQIGKCYLLGMGLPRDIDQAKHWFSLAASQGNLYAELMLDRMATYERDCQIETFLTLFQILSDHSDQAQSSHYPLSRLEGHALKEKILELKFGSNMYWDKGHGYER